MQKHCSIILVNWNGWEDTIECLETVLKQNYGNYDVVLVDNGSDDQSVERIKEWANLETLQIETKFPQLVYPIVDRPVNIEIIKEFNLFKSDRNNNKPAVYIIRNSENLGFAKANNIAIFFAINFLESDYLFLLNNDTVIEKDCLSKLIEMIEIFSEYSAMQSAIYYYKYPEKIWHVGGRILPWMQTKYYRKIKHNEVKQVYFISGCALFLTRALINSIGALSEKFFHGEEDFEFSMRLKKNNLKAAVVQSSKVYHKIETSLSKRWEKDTGRLLNFALNRLINIRSFFPEYKWKIWAFFTIIYFYQLMVFKYNLPIKYSFNLAKGIYHWSNILDEVRSNDVEQILRNIQ